MIGKKEAKNRDFAEATRDQAKHESFSPGRNGAESPASTGGFNLAATAAYRPVDAASAKARRGAHARVTPDAAAGSTSVMPVDVSRRARGGARQAGPQQPGPQHSANGSAFEHAPKSRKGKAAAITAGAVVLLLAVVYVAGAVMFTGRFYPNTVMGALDLSMKGADEAAAMLSEAERDYTLQVEGQGLDFTISSVQAGIGVDARAIVEEALADSEPWKWPLRIGGSHDETERMVAASDTESLSEAVHEVVDAFNEAADPSADAHVAFDADQGAYAVIDEVYGKQVSADAVTQAAAQAIASMQDSVKLTDEVLIKPAVLAGDSRLAAAADKANLMIGCDVVLKSSTDGTKIAELDGSTISQWITFDENMEPVLDSAALDAWANKLASSLDTVGKTRSYTRPDGKHVEVGGGDYGWKVDSAALVSAIQEAVGNGTVGDLEIPTSVTGNGYTAPGRDWDAYCDIDLTEQHAYYYDESGALVWDAPIVTGKPNGDDDTPTGVYSLKNLQRDVSLRGPVDPETNKPEWDSPVDYWMPFVGNMIGLHDAPWQPDKVFGDPNAYKTYGSHGCINLSVDKAAALFGVIKTGDAVIVHW
ncbi:MAG: L,D-transpeptidase family protein [Slackia faecicanis]|nr:L,D-transpeptidase family protein [Slackia faecicanis]